MAINEQQIARIVSRNLAGLRLDAGPPEDSERESVARHPTRKRIATLPTLLGYGGMDRRTFGKLCGMGVTGLAFTPWRFLEGAQLAPAPVVSPLPGSVMTMDLAGTGWTLQQVGEKEKLPAQVPGEHYSDLLRAGKIPDPYFRDNNQAVQWAAKTGWIYQRTFEATSGQLAMKTVELVCHGLDTLATVTLNGTVLGSTDNMFRTWVFDVRHALKAGTNDLQIQFQPVPEAPEVKARSDAYLLAHPDAHPEDVKHHVYRAWSWIRKAPYQWGWDWCRPLLTMGIWKGIELRAYDSRLANLAVVQQHHPDGSVQMDLSVDVAGQPPSGCQVSARLVEEGAPLQQPLAGQSATLTLTVPTPKLWWPNGLGGQPLYTVDVQLIDAAGKVLDTMRKRIGLRQFETTPATHDVPYTLKVNGSPSSSKARIGFRPTISWHGLRPTPSAG